MLKQFKNRKNIKRTFSTYLVSFLVLIFTVTSVILLFSFEINKSSLADEIVTSQSLSLEDKKTMLDSFMTDIINTTYNITLDSNVVVYTVNTSNKFLFNDIKTKIESIDMGSSAIMAIELYFEDNNELITSNGASSIINEELRKSWLSLIRTSTDKVLWTSPHTYLDSDFKEVPVISYIQKLPVTGNKALGYIAIHVNHSFISNILGSIPDSNSDLNKSIFIIHDNSTIISHSDISMLNTNYTYESYNKIVNSNYSNGFIMTNSNYNHQIINFIKLKSAPWIIISETPNALLKSKIKPLFVGTIITGLVAILIATFIAYLLTMRLYSPIKRLVDRTSSYRSNAELSERKPTELSFVSSLIDNLESNQKALIKELHVYQPVLVERFLKDLITNKFSDSTSIQQQLHHLHISLEHPYYCIFIIEVSDYLTLQSTGDLLEINTLFFAIKNIANEIISINDQGFCSDIEQGQVVVLLNLDDYIDPNEYLTSIATRLQTTILELLHIHTTISIGNIYGDITDLYLSYQEAKDIMSYKMVFDSQLLLYNDYNEESVQNYYNPIREIESLSEGIRLNQPDKLIATIQYIFTVLESKNQLSYENTFKVLNQILDVLQWTLNDLGYAPTIIWGKDFKLYKQLSQKNSLATTKEWFITLFVDTCNYILTNTKTEDSHVTKIKDFVNNNLSEDIYLDLIADHIGLNSSYMSRIFKKETNSTILEYINTTRIQKSKELLNSTDLVVKEIAKSVGFNNIHSFNRNFKTEVGTTPGQYRKSFLTHHY